MHIASKKRHQNDPTTLKVGELTLDLISRTAKRGERTIELLPKEFKLLEYFMLNEGKSITRMMALEKVWNYDFDTKTNIVDVHIFRLRNKIDKGFQSTMLNTMRGQGYVLTAGEQSKPARKLAV